MLQTNHMLCLIFFFIVFSSSSSSQPISPSYSDCAPFPYTCGSKNYTISFPFRIEGRPDFCGSPGYCMNCTVSTSTLAITISDKMYQITNIDYNNTLLNLVDTNFMQQTCPHAFANISMDTSLFQYSDHDLNMTLYINCTAPIPGLANIACLAGKKNQTSYYRLDNRTVDDLLGTCSSTVVVPLGQEAAEKLGNGSLGFGQALQQGFSVKWNAGMGWCSDCVSSGGYCGFFNGSAPQPACLCPNGMFVDSCNSSSSIEAEHGNGTSEDRKKIIIGVSVGFASFIVGSVVFILWFRSRRRISELLGHKKNTFHARTIETFLEKYGSLAMKRYTYSDIKKMTKSFSEKLGQGGYGIVYKGKLFDGHQVAVKILSETKDNSKDFINEVAAIGSTSHVNVVSLRGFCVEGSRRALIYDFMPNGSLDKYIYSDKLVTEPLLGWEKLYEIAVGIARGLEYLHRGCNTQIVHFDIKPHNILLDQDFCPKISDFGMAKLCPPKQSVISMYGARGTIGYIAPEVFSRTFGVVSSKSDVYSYGMMLLEMLGGKRRMNTRLESASEAFFPQSLYQHIGNNTDDIDLADYGVTGETIGIARMMMIVGFWCIQTMPGNRPSTSRMLEMLEGSIYELPIPPKPVLSSPLDLIEDSSSTSFS